MVTAGRRGRNVAQIWHSTFGGMLKPLGDKGFRGKKQDGGEAGIRTRGGSVSSLNGLASRRYRPLSHLSAEVCPARAWVEGVPRRVE